MFELMFFLQGIGIAFSLMLASKQDEKKGEVDYSKLFLIFGFATDFWLGMIFLLGVLLEKYLSIGFSDFLIVYASYVFFKPFNINFGGQLISFTAVFTMIAVLLSVVYYYVTKHKIQGVKVWRLRFIPFLLVAFGFTFLIALLQSII